LNIPVYFPRLKSWVLLLVKWGLFEITHRLLLKTLGTITAHFSCLTLKEDWYLGFLYYARRKLNGPIRPLNRMSGELHKDS